MGGWADPSDGAGDLAAGSVVEDRAVQSVRAFSLVNVCGVFGRIHLRVVGGDHDRRAAALREVNVFIEVVLVDATFEELDLVRVDRHDRVIVLC